MRLLREVLVRSEDEMMKLAEDVAKNLRGDEVICLKGELGAGKTTFVKGLAKALGIKEGYQVRSPTFTLVNEYPTQKGNLIHIDLYRVRDFDYSEFVGQGIVVVEWEEDRAKCNIVVEIEITNESERRVKIYGNDYL